MFFGVVCICTVQLGRVAFADARQVAMSQKLHLLFQALGAWYTVLETTPATEAG